MAKGLFLGRKDKMEDIGYLGFAFLHLAEIIGILWLIWENRKFKSNK